VWLPHNPADRPDIATGVARTSSAALSATFGFTLGREIIPSWRLTLKGAVGERLT
jgi:hypothetical protein